MKMNRQNQHIILLYVLILAAALCLGCAPVDRWPFWPPDYDDYTREPAVPLKETGNRYQPKMTDEPTVDLPMLGQPMPLSVEAAIIMALQNNRDLQIQRLNPVIAGTFERIERGKYDPELFAEFEYVDEAASETSRATGEQFTVEGTNTSAAAGIRQELPTGTTLEAALERDRDQSNRAPDQRTTRLGLSITQSLLRGFGPAVNLVNIRQAELDLLASIYELQGFTEALVAEIESAYWNYVLALEEIRIYESSLKVAKKQRDEIEEQISVGLLPETEAAAARAEVARREQALINARSLMEERRLKLLDLINLNIASHLEKEIRATSEPFIDPQAITNLAERLALAEKSRPDLAEARLRMKQGRLETIATRNGMMPKLDLFIDLGRTGYAESFPEAFREFNDNTYDFSAGVRLSHYLGNREAEARYEAAWTEEQQAKRAVDNLSHVVQLDVRLAVNEVERSRQQITASKATRQLEEQTVRAEKERFNVGASTALLVAQAQRDLLASQIAEIRAIVNYRIALVELYLAEGSLLQRRGITIGDYRIDNSIPLVK